MDVKIESSWKELLAEEFEQDYFKQLADFVRQEYRNHQVYPPGPQVFSAFDYCPVEKVRAVIIGQDPYHGAGQAHGLCFSVSEGTAVPPSLQNIFKELKADLGVIAPGHGCLERWAKQGVLMLNATLTVRAGVPGSHQNRGWEKFTDAVIQQLNVRMEGLVFMLWGAYAQRKGAMIDRTRHCVIESAHPSPFAAHRGFFGSRPFSRTNEYLVRKGKSPIDW